MIMIMIIKWRYIASVQAFTFPFTFTFTGVRQSAVLSPVLFTVYVNEIICIPEAFRYGCRVDGKYVGILMYADDLLLISASWWFKTNDCYMWMWDR